MPRVRLRLLRWLLLVGVVSITAIADSPLTAQDKTQKGQVKEVEDKTKGKTKPVPNIDDTPTGKTGATPDAPGVRPAAGTLIVAVRSLPEYMSPALARSDSEKYVLDLIFEGLLRPVADSAAGMSYEPALARAMPRIVPGGREFTLAQADWADPDHLDSPKPVTMADVRSTVDRLRSRKDLLGGELGRLIEAVDVTDARERCVIHLTQGQPDPLALMTFKILPSTATDDLTYARKPVGSGPYMYGGNQTEGGRRYAVFPANPRYGQRAGRTNRPFIREVRLLESSNPAADFNKGLAHLALTTHTDEVATLTEAPKADGGAMPQGRIEVILPGGKKALSLPSRRVYFLAVNHARPALGGARGTELRRLLAYAIQREPILTTCFRAPGYAYHQPLTGPFPPETWPCDPTAERLDEPDLARDAATRVQVPAKLDLKYPEGDPAVKKACEMICAQLVDLKINVGLTPLPPEEMRRKVEVETDFDLAYWHYDYPNLWFSPVGLFDPAAQKLGGRNFMHYRPSADVSQALERSENRREFAELRKAMHQLHAAFRTEMPFIPLWHLETHVLFAPGLRIEPSVGLLDPLAPFVHIDQWQLGS